MLHAFAICKPRDADREFIKPRYALAYPLAIMRIFKRWGILMPSYKMLMAELQGISRLYVAYHGPHSLAPRRAEPMKFSMVASINAVYDVQVGSRRWTDDDHLVFIFRRLNLVLIRTGFRLAEVVAHTSGEVMYLTFGCLTWMISGVPVADPTPAQLRALQPGDCAQLAPSRSKPDQWGEIHCPFPVTLRFDASPENGANALRDLELRFNCNGRAREATALFGDASGQPYTHSVFDPMLRSVLTHLYGARIAALYTFHSYRSGLAVALHAAGCPDAMIQLICHWMCPESLHIYWRMGTQEHADYVERASRASLQVIQATNVPRVSNDQGYAALLHDLTGPGSAAAQGNFDGVGNAPLRRRTAGPSPLQPRTHAPSQITPPAASPPPPPTQRPPSPLTADVAVGRTVLVPRSVYPTYECTEHGGRG